MEKNVLPIKKAVFIFFVFACGYFISALLRAITATLSPLLTSEFNLTAGDLGLLAGGYFLGFASMQIPLGYLLDRHGPKKVVSSFLLIAIIGTIAFALAQSFSGLLISRILIGVGVSACLMGPLTAYRVWFADEYQQRANAWMLMVLSMGFVFSTLPVQLLLPIIGWRWIFGLIVILILFVIILTFPKRIFNLVFETLPMLFDHTLATPVSSVIVHKLGSLSSSSSSISLRASKSSASRSRLNFISSIIVLAFSGESI